MEVGVINYSKVWLLKDDGSTEEVVYSLPPKEALKVAVNQTVFGIWLEQNYKEVDIIETEVGYTYQFGNNTALWVRK